MDEQGRPPAPPELFFDSYDMGINEFGANVRLSVTAPRLAGEARTVRHLVTLRMAPATMKILAYQMARSVVAAERERGTTFDLSAKTLNEMASVALEDWRSFWAGVRGPEGPA